VVTSRLEPQNGISSQQEDPAAGEAGFKWKDRDQ
jgi:hypothetical protein